MRPDVVTFWHGPLDGLRLTCLRSQVAAGHKVTVYSFDPLPGLPDGFEVLVVEQRPRTMTRDGVTVDVHDSTLLARRMT